MCRTDVRAEGREPLPLCRGDTSVQYNVLFGGSSHVGEVFFFCSNKNSSPSFWLLLTLYSCGNVIVLVIVHLINNWFMMILVAVYVYLKINAMKSPSS